ncbi:MAG: helix-turn-helix transcriptional regulator [Roseburia sp.]|nr:helix-turn-helix transcriptional regulator [Roseburia sp.]
MKKKGVIYRKLILSLAGMLLIPIGIVLVFYLYLYHALGEQAVQSNYNFLQTIQSVCDMELEYYQNQLLDIGNGSLAELERLKDVDENESNYQRYLLVKELSAKKTAVNMRGKYCNGIFVYWSSTEKRIMSEIGINNIDIYLSQFIDTEDFDTVKQYFTNGGFQNIYYVPKCRSNENYFLLTTNYVNGNLSENSIIGMWLDTSMLTNCIGTVSWKSGAELALLDETGKVIYSSVFIENMETGKEALLENDFLEIDGNKYIAYMQASEIASWRYVLLIPEKQIRGVAINIRNVFFLCIVACVYVGWLMAKKTLKHNYEPINDLMKILENNEPPSEEVLNEHLYLKRRIENVLSDYQSANRKITNYQVEMKEYYWKSVLLGNADSRENRIKLKDMQIEDDPQKKGMVLTVRWEKPKEEENHNEMEEQELWKFVVTNVFEEGLGELFEYRMAAFSDSVAFILLEDCMEKGVDDFYGRVQEKTAELQSFLEESFQMITWVAAGSLHSGIKGIHESFAECQETEEFFGKLKQNYICYIEIKDRTLRKYVFSYECQERIVAAVRANNPDIAMVFIDEVLRNTFEDGKGAFSEIKKCIIYDLYATIIKIAEEKRRGQLCFPVLEELLQCGNRENMKERFGEMLKVVCDKEDTRADGSNVIRCRKIREYIEKNYSDANLNVSGIGEYFEMSPFYLSSMYKKETGDSLVTVINEVRVQKAADFLQEGKTVAEATLMCGFTDCSAFIRVFKKKIGVTPGQYKKMYVDQ